MSDFWARRKAAVLAEEHEAAQLAKAEAQIAREEELAERSDEEILAELELPDPDTLEEGDDFKVFLNDAVPARIRTRALRRLWRLNPVLANVDGLVDYGEDFNDASFIIENMQTAYQVGKGMTEHVLELARQAEEAAKAEEDGGAEESVEDEPLAVQDEDSADDEDALSTLHGEGEQDAAVGYVFADTDLGEDIAPTAARRMRFAFDVPHSEAHG